MTTARNHLPQRRPSLTQTTRWRGQTITVCAGFDPATGELSEVFADVSGRAGSDLSHTVSDAAVLVSLLLQHGVELAAIRHSLSRAPGAFATIEAGSPVGIIADALAAMAEPAEQKNDDDLP